MVNREQSVGRRENGMLAPNLETVIEKRQSYRANHKRLPFGITGKQRLLFAAILSLSGSWLMASPGYARALAIRQPDLSRGQYLIVQAESTSLDAFTRTGRLTPEDEKISDGTHVQEQTFEGQAGQTITIDLESPDFDAYLLLLDPDDNLVGEDDDSGEGTDARLSLTLANTGIYSIIVNTAFPDEVGNYTLTVAPASDADLAQAEINTVFSQVLTLYEQERYGEAITGLEQVLALQRQSFGEQHPEVALTLRFIGQVYNAQGDLTKTESYFLQALAIYENNSTGAETQYIDTLDFLGQVYMQQGRYPEAETVLQQAINLFKDRELTWVLGRIYNNLAEAYRQQYDLDASADTFRDAISVFEQTLGPSATEIATTQINLGLVEVDRNNYSQAEMLYQQSIAVLEAELEDDHPNIARAYLNLGDLYAAQGRYDEAEAQYQETLARFQARYGDLHPELLGILGSMGQLYQNQGRFDEAEDFLRQALTVAETSIGAESTVAADMLHRLSKVYLQAGRYDEAESAVLKALDLQGRLLGTDHYNYATTLNSLALLYSTQGRYPEASPIYEEALGILEASLGEFHPNVATTLSNWAELLRTQGNYDAALPLYRRALAIQDQVLGENHPDRATTLNNLSLLAHETDRIGEAASLLEEALRILESSLGEDHPDVGLALNNLADNLRLQGKFAASQVHLERALALQQKALSAHHPDLGLTVNNLGMVTYLQKDLVQAKAYFQQSLDIFRQSLGEKHPLVALVLNNLAYLTQSQGQISESLSYLQQSQAIESFNLNLVLSTGSESTKAAYLQTLPPLSNHISFHLLAAQDNPAAAELALLSLLQRKGRVLDAVTDNLKVLRQRLDPADQALLEDWAGLRSQLATLLVGGVGGQSPEVYQAKLSSLEQQIQSLEKTLGDRSRAFQTEVQPITLESVQTLLPEDSALVEFVAYKRFLPGPDEFSTPYSESRYGVYVLKPSGDIHWQDLGEATEIDEQIEALRRLLQGRSNRYVPAAKALYTSLFQSLEPELADVEHLLISPDGQLNLIPFSSLMNEASEYVLETHQVTYLTSGRDLLRLQETTVSDQAPVLIADPNYDTADGSVEPTITDTPPTLVASARGNQRAADMSTLTFGPLEGTAIEAKEISSTVVDAQVLTGTGATENALKRLQAPRILHIATHGFFLQDSATESNPWGAQSFNNRGTGNTTEITDPLLRSGLALAGFNTRQSGDEDGVLTALEAASLDLNGTQLVVLSACETGVGQAINGEGVFGLRRAFVMAGAQTQILSLWRVDDHATKDLMVGYYQRLEADQGRSAGLRDMQLEMLNGDEYSHPYYWAAFIPSGDWQPMP